MPTGPAARITDPVAHLTPGVLTTGPGSLNVYIGGLPAWRGVPAAVAATLQAAKTASDARVAANPASAAAEAAQMATMITSMSGGADIHMCVHMAPVPVPPPHGPGVVITGSQTVLINNLPACRVGDMIVESFGPPDNIVMGHPQVYVGG